MSTFSLKNGLQARSQEFFEGGKGFLNFLYEIEENFR